MRRALLWVASRRIQLGQIALGHLLNHASIILFDYLLYPAAMVWFGLIEGGLIMTTLSAVYCYFIILVYRWSGRDWLGIEIVRSIRDGPQHASNTLRILRAILKSGQIPALIILSVRYDPFITVTYLRHGTPGWSGLSGQDWMVFWTSLAISNLWWIGALSIVIEVLKQWDF